MSVSLKVKLSSVLAERNAAVENAEKWKEAVDILSRDIRATNVDADEGLRMLDRLNNALDSLDSTRKRFRRERGKFKNRIAELELSLSEQKELTRARGKERNEYAKALNEALANRVLLS